MKERVQKLMAQANIGSRRACEEIISAGRVRVNGEVIELGAKADPDTDIIEVDGESIHPESRDMVYIAFNKPKNVVSTTAQHRGEKRRTVREMIPLEGHLFMIGRLDAESEGLMVLTNDGDLANKLMHPRYRHTKTYKVTVYGLPTKDAIEQWEKGVDLGEEGVTAPCTVRVLRGNKGFSTLEITMTEGKKRQIRRVATHLGFPVKKLVRTHIGKLALGDLPTGEWRELDEADLEALKARERVALKDQPQRRPQRRNTRQPASRRPGAPSSNRQQRKPNRGKKPTR